MTYYSRDYYRSLRYTKDLFKFGSSLVSVEIKVSDVQTRDECEIIQKDLVLVEKIEGKVYANQESRFLHTWKRFLIKH